MGAGYVRGGFKRESQEATQANQPQVITREAQECWSRTVLEAHLVFFLEVPNDSYEFGRNDLAAKKPIDSSILVTNPAKTIVF